MKPTVKLTIPTGAVEEPVKEPDTPLSSMRREERGKFHVVTSLAGWKYYITPSQ